MKYSSIGLLRLPDNEERHELLLSPKEMSVTPNVVAINEAVCTFSAVRLSEAAFLVRIDFRLQARLLDDHDLQVKEFTADNFEEVVASYDPDIESDLEKDSSGCYDFRPVCLALYYDTVPYSYSTKILTKREIAGVTIISEDEFKKTNGGNAFKNLSLEDDED